MKVVKNDFGSFIVLDANFVFVYKIGKMIIFNAKIHVHII